MTPARPLWARLAVPALLLSVWYGIFAITFLPGASFEHLVWALPGLVAGLSVAFVRLDWQLFGPAIVRGPATGDAVFLTFDDGPDPEYTPRVLDTLAAFGAKATFFVVGERVEAQPELARRIVEEGHQLGHHGHRHLWLGLLRPKVLWADFARGQEAIRAATGRTPRLHRPPVGLVAPPTVSVCSDWSCELAAWSRRPRDGTEMDPEVVISRVLRGIGPGEIVLLHDAPGPTHRGRLPAAVEALPRLLEELTRLGLRSATLAELMERDPYLEEEEVARGVTAQARFTWLEPIIWVTFAVLCLALGFSHPG